jgi:flagellar protein FliO/FliZ
MTKPNLLSRAVATATAASGACLPVTAGVLAYALLGALASPAAAYSPSLKDGSENTPLNLGSSGTSTHTSSSGGASLVRTIVGLAIVIAVIWGLAWVLRQFKAKGAGGANASSDGLASVAALTLGSGRSVHLVRAGSDYVLLGATEHGVAPIHRYTEEQAREAGLLPAESQGARASIIAGAAQLIAGTRPGQDEEPWIADQVEHSPVAGHRPDPMLMQAPSTNVIDRLRELTVRR